jgi:hypothetical protein
MNTWDSVDVAMDLLTQVSLLGCLISAIIAIALSPLLNVVVCDFLAPHQVALKASSVYGVPFHAIHERVCGPSSIQDKQNDWNLFYHLGGNGPWIEKLNARFGTYDEDGKTPEGCVVDQVHMV